MAAQKQYCDDFSHWWGNRNEKKSPNFSDFKHDVNKDSYGAPWVRKELKGKRSRGIKHGCLCNMVENIVGCLKACVAAKDLSTGSKLHAYIRNHKFLGKDVYIGSALVNMYAKCGAFIKAEQVLKEFPVRDVVTWSALIAGYAQQGHGEEALKCFDDMLQEGHSPNAVTFGSALQACGSIGALAKGINIHDEIVRLGMLAKDVVLGNILVGMYLKCRSLAKAQQVLEELPARSVVSWSALIAGYVQQEQGGEALKCFDDMLHEGLSPDVVAFTYALKACGIIGAAAKGEEIHDKIVSLGILENDIVLGATLVDMYVKCDALAKARHVLEELPTRDVVTWSALIVGYTQKGQGEEALKCFHDMLHEGHTPDTVSFICILKACASIGTVAKGEEIHDIILSLGMLQKDVALGNVLVDMYVKCGALAKAQRMLEELPIRDVIAWSALIAGYAEQGQGEEALKCFSDMIREGCCPNVVTYIYVLKACGCIGAVAKLGDIHDKIVSLGILEKNIVLGTTLVDMYAKCGVLIKAQRVLEELSIWNVITWSALIAGYAQQGQSLEVVDCFERMQLKGLKPNSVTLASVLNACCHSGLLDQAETYFSQMGSKYGIHPDSEHCCCMIDLFARAGKFNKALSLIEVMPLDECFLSWVALLGACRKWEEVKVGRLAFEHAFYLDKNITAIYNLMGDIYAAAGFQEEVGKIEILRLANKTAKKLGR